MIIMTFFTIFACVFASDTMADLCSDDSPFCDDGIRLPCQAVNKVNTDGLIDAGIGLATGMLATYVGPMLGLKALGSFMNPFMSSTVKAGRALNAGRVDGVSSCEYEIIDWVMANFVTIDDFDAFKEDVAANFLLSSIIDDFKEMDNARQSAEERAVNLLDNLEDVNSLASYAEHLYEVVEKARNAISATLNSIDSQSEPSAVQAGVLYILEGSKVAFQALASYYTLVPYCWNHGGHTWCSPSTFMSALENFKGDIETWKSQMDNTVYPLLRAERADADLLQLASYAPSRSLHCIGCDKQVSEEWCGDNDAGCGSGPVQNNDSDEWCGDNDAGCGNGSGFESGCDPLTMWCGDDRRQLLKSKVYKLPKDKSSRRKLADNVSSYCWYVTTLKSGECRYVDFAFKTGDHAYQQAEHHWKSDGLSDSMQSDKCYTTTFAADPYNPKCSDTNANNCDKYLSERTMSVCSDSVKNDLRDELVDEYEAELAAFQSQLFQVPEVFSAVVELTLYGEFGLEQVNIWAGQSDPQLVVDDQRVAMDGTVFRFNVPESDPYYKIQWTWDRSDGTVTGEGQTFAQNIIYTFAMSADAEYIAAPSGDMADIVQTMMDRSSFDLSALTLNIPQYVSVNGMLATQNNWYSEYEGNLVIKEAETEGFLALPVHQSGGDRYYDIEVDGWKGVTFTIQGECGGELVTIVAGSSEHGHHGGSFAQTMELTAEELEFTVPLKEAGTFIVSYNVFGCGIIFKTESNVDITHPDKWSDWNCGMIGGWTENSACDEIRNGHLHTTGYYRVSMVRTDDTPEARAKAHYAQCGAPNGCVEGVEAKLNTDVLGVRCVSDTAIAGWAGPQHIAACNGIYWESDVWGGCKWLNYDDAKAFCASVGGRLPTLDEVNSRCVVNTGCNHDFTQIWTSTRSDFVLSAEVCPDACNTITSATQCSEAGQALSLGNIQVQHKSGRLPGCFYYTPTGKVEYNADISQQAEDDWGSTTFSIYDCRHWDADASFELSAYEDEYTGQSVRIVGESSDDSTQQRYDMVKVRATDPFTTIAGLTITKRIS